MFGRLPFRLGTFRPDLIDTARKQLFEIKTIREFPQGQAKLTLYLLVFNWADPDKSRPWTRGTPHTYSPPHVLPLYSPGRFAIVSVPVAGVILYEIIDIPMTVAGLAAVAVLSNLGLGAKLTGDVGFASQSALAGVTF